MNPVPVEEHADSIAVVGMAARLPGAPDVARYWANLREGAESIVRHTREEMLANGAREDLIEDPYYVNASAPLEGAECFDAAFFGYSAREAAIMDPQHRVFLECAYHALEDAGHESRGFDGDIGVFGGCTMNTYLLYNIMPHADDVVALVGDLQMMVGNDKEYLPTRVSHKLDLRGPSVGIQTACSSSLVAVHFACRSLLDGDCDMALAGGSSVRMPHAAGYLSTPGGTSSPDGHCRSFDADAAGSVVGSGAGVVVLRRLADALRDGDQIHAVIRGTAVNNDGAAKASFTAPSVDGQSRAVARALRRAGVSARDIQLVEAHGTATPLGDPIEVAALTKAFREWTDDTEFCWLGSAKANIGHLDAAAGVAGLIKTVLALKHRRIPPVVNFVKPNPQLNLPSTPFRVPDELSRFDSDGPLLASVNSLAMGGTNAHVVVESAPAARPTTPSPRREHTLVLSARSADALEEQSQALGRWTREHPQADPADVAHTLAVGRRTWEYRRVVQAGDLEELSYALSAANSRRRRDSGPSRARRVAFLFPGQGAQRLGMGSALAAGEPVFAEHLARQVDLFRQHGELDLEPYLSTSAGSAPDADERRAALAGTDVTQPALFAVQTALARTLIEYGVKPYAMFGHSIGELVAAGLSGVLDEADAVRLVLQRAAAMEQTEPGAMLWARLAPEALPDDLGDGVSLAAVNADELVTVAGPVGSIDALQSRWREEHVVHGRLEVTRAFHSELMDPAATAVAAAAAQLSLHAPELPVISDVTGEYLTAEQATDPQYWAEQVRRPVRFAAGLQTLLRDGVSSFVEVGPGTALTRMVGPSIGEARARPTLHDDAGTEAGSLTELLTDHWLDGGEVNWATGYRHESRARLSLPGYPFARTRHWMDPVPAGRAVAGAAPTAAAPALTGSARSGTAPARSASPARSAPASTGGTPMERYLRSLWERLLGSDTFGDDESFFEVGGHSLLAMQMVTQLRRDGAGELELTTLFQTPTLIGLAARLEELGVAAPATGDPAAVPGPSTPSTPPADPVAVTPSNGSTGSASTATDIPVRLPRPPAPDPDDDDLLAQISALSDDEVRERLQELERGEHR